MPIVTLGENSSNPTSEKKENIEISDSGKFEDISSAERATRSAKNGLKELKKGESLVLIQVNLNSAIDCLSELQKKLSSSDH